MGTMHGGVLRDLADAAMGMAFASTLATFESFQDHIAERQLLSTCLGSATACRSPRSEPREESGLYECDIADQDGKQIAKASCSCFVLRGEHAKQR